jgi:hypothetical protein
MPNKTWIKYMLFASGTARSEAATELLEHLPLRELKVLHKNSDLVDEIIRICKLTKEELVTELRDRRGFSFTSCGNGDLWVDGEPAESLVPKGLSFDGSPGGVKLPFPGWYLTYLDGPEAGNEFVPWARNILLSEIRINLWMRYLEHKVSTTSGAENPFKRAATSPSDEDPGYGNYI